MRVYHNNANNKKWIFWFNEKKLQVILLVYICQKLKLKF